MSALSSALEIILSRVRGRRLAGRIARATPAITPVAVYFADGPQSLYQLRRWYRVLEALNAEHLTSIITSDPSTYAIVRRETTVAVTYASGAPELARVLERQDVRVVLYPNHNALNFRMLRFATPVHVFIGHGESGKESSVSRQLKAYDLDFVADEAAIEGLRGIRRYDADANAVVVGSPWLGFLGAPPTSWSPDERRVVLYAPTWEGDRPSMDYSSVELLGENIVASVLNAPGLRLIYRPHPWLGRVRAASAEADARIRRAIIAANRGDIVDTGEYGWVLDAADVCVTDVSSVVSDIRALGKPLLIAETAAPAARPPSDATFDGAVRIDSANVSRIIALLERSLATGVSSVAETAASRTTMESFLAGIAVAIDLAR